jgi:dolichyl-phosphate-mannose-protein mannosyltransferase
MTVIEAARTRGLNLTFDRWSAVSAAAALLAAALVAALAYRIVSEHGGVNSYALLADAFLHGRFDSPTCFDSDCARFMERIYVIFPPVPALVAAPLVALFGPDASGFVFVSAALWALTGLAWWKIAGRLGLGFEARAWTVAAFMFGAPAIFVALRGDGVWFFAQVVALALTSFAILAALDRRLALAGALIGLAFLSRQMAIFLAPFLFVLARPGEKLIGFDRRTIGQAFSLALPILAAIAVYSLYNWARFGAPFDTGYAHIADYPAEDDRNFITWRILDYGLFSKKYLVFNLAHMFVQGFHLEFGGKYMTDLVRVDPMGTSILAASPFVLYAFYARPDMRLAIGLPTILVVAGITMFYHSNGFSQQNVQRYALDWLPVLYVLLMAGAFAGAPEKVAERLRMFKLLATYAIGLNVVAFAAAAVTKGAI